ncbi:hypothetical protein QFZ24_009834 [Streptomyces phaeochromogenes]|nr:hypothetical protein [Streptomyces phaeochromogenes]
MASAGMFSCYALVTCGFASALTGLLTMSVNCSVLKSRR